MDAHTPAQNRLIGASLVLIVFLAAAGIFQLTRRFDALLTTLAPLPLLTRLSLSWPFHLAVPALTALAYVRVLAGARNGLQGVACTGALLVIVGALTLAALYLPIVDLAEPLPAPGGAA